MGGEVLTDLVQEHGDIVMLDVFGKKTIIISHPDLIRKVYANDGEYPFQPAFDQSFGFYRNTFRPEEFKESKGLVGSSGEDWWKIRSSISSDMLKPKVTNIYYDMIY